MKKVELCRQHIENKMPVNWIAEQLGVSKQYVYNVRTKMKNKKKIKPVKVVEQKVVEITLWQKILGWFK